jgi:hypothetical protein
MPLVDFSAEEANYLWVYDSRSSYQAIDSKTLVWKKDRERMLKHLDAIAMAMWGIAKGLFSAASFIRSPTSESGLANYSKHEQRSRGSMFLAIALVCRAKMLKRH